MLFSYILLSLGWAAFYVLHSVLAATEVKNYLNVQLGRYQIYYRLLYNIFFGLFFLGLIVYQAYLPSQIIFVFPFILKIIAFFIFLLGLLILRYSFKNYQLSEFMGVEQLKKKQNIEYTQLVTTGLNAIVRHPIYLGSLLIVVGFLLNSFSIKNLIFFLFFMLYLIVGIYIEEKKLVIFYGEAYKKYQSQVKRLIPYIF